MPEDGIDLIPHCMILSYEAIAQIANVAGMLGITKVRITGGEPLVRRDIESLVRMMCSGWTFDEVCMTTNGSLLTRSKASALKTSGLARVNISLDTLDAACFSSITRGGNLRHVLSGIDAALAADLTPVKINMVIRPSTTCDEIEHMQQFCMHNGLKLQTISQFSLSDRGLQTSGPKAADRPPDCSVCNRLRLTSDGCLKPCLFSSNEVKVNLNDIEESFRFASQTKPAYGTCGGHRSMSQVGG
jgi:cyclic pyranopterin phosphate synthase